MSDKRNRVLQFYCTTTMLQFLLILSLSLTVHSFLHCKYRLNSIQRRIDISIDGSKHDYCPLFKNTLHRQKSEETVVEREYIKSAHSVLPFFTIAIAAFLALPVQSALASTYFESISSSASESGLIQSFLLIFISEIGDKTFFIAALLAAKYGRLISFTGSVGALAVMTVISTVLGQVFHAVPSSLTQGIPFDDYIAVAAFTYFGIKTLLDASKLEAGDSSGIEEEKAEAEELVEEVTADQKRKSIIALILQTFSLVFAAEIGDRSFLSTIGKTHPI